MNAGTTTLGDLSELVRLARVYRDAAIVQHRPGTAQTWDNLASHLDAVRTTLIQEGDTYEAVARAFVDSGRLTISRALAREGRRPDRGVSHTGNGGSSV